MATRTLVAMDEFVGGMRDLWSQPGDERERWEKAADLLRKLLADPDLKARSADWPVCHYENLLFYEDPDHGFVINALVKDPHGSTPVHDHAHTWTLYGVLEGSETIDRYERADDGSRPGHAELRLGSRFAVAPGDVDCVEPWLIHAETNGPDRAVAIIIRSQKLGSFVQNIFDPASQSVAQRPGPTPVPYPLA